MTREILHHLMDGVDPADVQAASEAALRVDGVRDVAVRGRVTAAVFDAVRAARRLNWIPSGD